MRVIQAAPDAKTAITKKWRGLPQAMVPDGDEVGDRIERDGKLGVLDPRRGNWLRNQEDLDVEKVLRFAEELDDLPPIAVARHGSDLVILDGHHRWLAAWLKHQPVAARVMDVPTLFDSDESI